MNVLAISSFGTLLEIGLKTDTGYYENRRRIGLKHNQILLTQIDSVLNDGGIKPRQIDLILCSGGPGSFTAIRIVMSTAKGLAAGSDAVFLHIPTFDIIGHLFSWFPHAVVPIIDGRKGKFYTAVYQNGKKCIPESDISPAKTAELVNPFKQILIVGEDADSISKQLPIDTKKIMTVTNGFTLIDSLLDLGIEMYKREESCDIMCSPLYIRKSDAELEKEQRL